jgi:nucleoside-diphosphate-sugar epimerase
VNAWRWIDQLLRALGRRTGRYQVPLGAARAACGLLEFAYGALPLPGEPPATRFLANELAMSHYYDISRARHDLNYVPQFTMEEATQLTIAYFREVMA